MKKLSGFTLLELLVTLTIIGILSSTAVPYYRDYQKRGYDTQAQSDVRIIALAEEAYYLDQEEYLSCKDTTCLALPSLRALSAGVTVTVTANDDDTFLAKGTHTKGSGKVYIWDSTLGGMQEQ